MTAANKAAGRITVNTRLVVCSLAKYKIAGVFSGMERS
jgi:hypothetical protein